MHIRIICTYIFKRKKNIRIVSFQETFEKVYNKSSLSKRPWYFIAGNHDHHGNMQAQFDYSLYSDKWSVRQMSSIGKLET